MLKCAIVRLSFRGNGSADIDNGLSGVLASFSAMGLSVQIKKYK